MAGPGTKLSRRIQFGGPTGTKLPRHGAGIMCDKVRPARGLHRLTRDKIRPAQPLLQCFREKTRPARHKPPILGHFSCAGRTFSRIRPPPDQAGRTLYRTRGRCRYKTRLAYPVRRPTRYKTLPAHWPGGPNRYKTLPAHPKPPFLTSFTRAGRTLYRSHQQQATQGEESHAPTLTSPHQREPPPISHVIRLHETSTTLRNVAIPTITIQILKHSHGNYVRN